MRPAMVYPSADLHPQGEAREGVRYTDWSDQGGKTSGDEGHLPGLVRRRGAEARREAGGEDEETGARGHVVAEDGQREREAVEGAAGLAVAAWKQQSQRRRRGLWRGTPEHPDPHGASRGGYLSSARVRQLDAPQNERRLHHTSLPRDGSVAMSIIRLNTIVFL